MITRELVRRQIDLENEARSLGAIRYRQARPMPWRDHTDDVSVEEEANLPPGQRLLKIAVEPTAALIRQFVEDAHDGKAGRKHSAVKWMELADPEEIAYLAARVAVNASIKRATLQGAAIQLGDAIMAHVDMLHFKQRNPGGYWGLIKKNARKSRGAKRRFESVRKLLEREESRATILPTSSAWTR